VAEYEARSWIGRLKYRAYRSPLVLFLIGPAYVFFVEQRLPVGYWTAGKKYWLSSMGTNLGIALLLGAIVWFGGWKPLVLIFIPSTMLAACLGVWLFYVQHQFEGVYWARRRDWDALRAAMDGSSFYTLPAGLRWFSANIGYHHVHHLNSRIPNYRLKQCCESVSALREKPALTIRRSLSAIHLKLWDEERKMLISFP